MSPLDWIGQLAQWIGAWVPQWVIVRPRERLIKLRPRSPVLIYEARPGRANRIVFYWPVFTHVLPIFVGRQTLSLPPQTLTTKDGAPVVATGVVVFSIEHVERYALENWDSDEAIAEVAGAALRKAVIGKTFDEIQGGRAEIDNVISREVTKLVEPFGVKIEYARLVSFAKAKVLNLVTVQQSLTADRAQGSMS